MENVDNKSNLKRQIIVKKKARFSKDHNTTFRQNLQKPIHQWYSYVEGFSWGFIQKVFEECNVKSNSIILDPFSGSGSTLVESSLAGIKSYGYDINPFMTFASKTKTNFSIPGENLKKELLRFYGKIESYSKLNSLQPKDVGLSELFANNIVFGEKILPKILFMKKYLSSIKNKDIQDFFTLAFCSIMVEISNYRRGPDLAMKKKPLVDTPVFERFIEKSTIMISDLENISKNKIKKPIIHNGDSKKLEKIKSNFIDLVITSPPYLNGTNYFRNTKLELWFTGKLKETKDLHTFREKAITGGINDAFKSKHIESTIPNVQKLLVKVRKNAYDSRIPIMVSTYFEEISSCFENIFRVMKPSSKCYWVVGDSAFSNIKIPTDVISIEIAEKVGFKHERTDIIRERKSRGGMILHEVVIVLKKE